MRYLSIFAVTCLWALPAFAQIDRKALCADLAQIAGQTVLKRDAGTSLARTERQLMRAVNDKSAAYKTIAPSVIQWAYLVDSSDANQVATEFQASCLKG